VKQINLPGLSGLFGRSPKSSLKKREDQIKAIRGTMPGQLIDVIGDAIPPETIPLAEKSRERVFSTRTTTYAFLSQVLRGGSQRDAVREVQAARHRLGMDAISDSTAAYSTARKRLPEEIIEGVHERLCQRLQADAGAQGRRVVVVDGSSCQLADTEENQLDYPQPSQQKPGCGWPVMQAVALYELETGAILRVAESAHTDSESSWFQVGLIDSIRKDDIVLTDRGFCSFLNFGLIAQQGADAVCRLHASRKVPLKAKENECVVTWQKPYLGQMPEHIFDEEWEQLPQTIQVRYIRFRIDRPGFRTRVIVLATTLMDTPAQELIDLYLRRWEIEVGFRDLKTTLGMEWINCRTPAMARKQLTMFLIAHNLIRWLMQRASRASGNPIRRLSFKGALDTMHRWAPEISRLKQSQKAAAWMEMITSIASDLLPIRPNRIEPRRQKRRPKYGYLTKPRNTTCPA
jgi:hypothetical protein